MGQNIRKRIKYSNGKMVEVEEVYTTRYCQNIPNGKRKKATPEEMAKVNERNRIKKLRRLIYENYSSNDWHLVLTYRKDDRPQAKDTEKYLDEFIRKMRKEYKKRGKPFKWIATTELLNKAIHHHLVINDYDFTVKLVKKLWQRGRANFSSLNDNDNYEELAKYLIKETAKTRNAGTKNKPTYRTSRNLRKPKTIVRQISGKNYTRKPRAPKGWYIVKETYREGISDITGRPYRYYTLMKLDNVASGSS